MQKCNGRYCIHRNRCLHYAESKKDTKTKGKWVDSERCINSEWDGDECTKMPYDQLLLKEEDNV